MASWWVTRRLRSISTQLTRLRDELHVADEQQRALADESTDLELRALVSDAPFDRSESRAASGHTEAATRHRVRLVEQIAKLEHEQDALLDRLSAG